MHTHFVNRASWRCKRKSPFAPSKRKSIGVVRSANVMLPSRVIRSIAALLFSALMQTAHKYAQDTFGTLMRCVFIFYRTVNLELRGNISAVGRYQDRNSIIFHIHYIIPFPCSSTVPIHFYVVKADLFALCEIFLLSLRIRRVCLVCATRACAEIRREKQEAKTPLPTKARRASAARCAAPSRRGRQSLSEW